MSIQLRTGDLFQSDAQTLVNATNTEGIMGGGIALAFKKRFPEMFVEYNLACGIGFHTTFRPHLWYADDRSKPWILNLATKDTIAKDSTLDNIEEGLEWLILNYERVGITSLAFPALGCGLGGLDWDDVLPVLEIWLSKLDIPVEIYEPLT